MKRIGIIAALIAVLTAVSGCAVQTLGADKNQTDNASAEKNNNYADYPKGYSLDLPEDYMQVDMTYGVYYTQYNGRDTKIVVSKEQNVYDDVIYYTNQYFDRFMLSPDYRGKNNIALNCHRFERTEDFNVKILSVTRKPYNGSEVLFNTYTYIYFYKDSADEFYRVMLKTKAYEPDKIDGIVHSFREVPVSGEAHNTIGTEPVLPPMNEETAKYYEELCKSDKIAWGIFAPEDEQISGLEEKLDYTFDIYMKYVHIPDEETDGAALEAAYYNGKTCELTLQTATLWNNDIDKSVNPNFKIIDGVLDDTLRRHARTVKEFGHPVIVRVNNEMNTDWTSYCGIQLMEDPEVYRDVFCRIIDIFKEEGADNAIWMFNPQFLDSPPANFNSYLGYFPGADKVQILGLTAYNSGTYRRETDGGIWREFEETYDSVNELYSGLFSKWPWMIGEFGSDSHGGDKAKWIEDMFGAIGKYKNIKGAVWLNWEAYDPRKGSLGIVSRCYRLDETEETTEAFKRGLHGGESAD